jgi:hypothetical protein
MILGFLEEKKFKLKWFHEKNTKKQGPVLKLRSDIGFKILGLK